MSDRYFTFPLAVLNYGPPLRCLELALDCGIYSAGAGYRKIHGDDAFVARFAERCEELGIPKLQRPSPFTAAAEVVVGGAVCNVKFGNHRREHFHSTAERAAEVPTGGPLVRMKADFLWAAIEQARADEDPDRPWPERGISWREFRVLCAILSVRTNRAGFAFVSVETIQARASGFTTKKALRSAESIPEHLAPPFTDKQIRTTCDVLENLRFFARFRQSIGPRGGRMAYSVRHNTREELAAAVCDFVNFRDRIKIAQNRQDDARKCLELLERAKSGQSQDNA